MGIDCCVFQNCAVCKADLAANGSARLEFAAVSTVIHGERTAALNVDDALHNGIVQCQFAAVFDDDAHAAENFHVGERQVAADRDVQCLRNVARFYLVPSKVIAEVAVCAALMRAEPDFEVSRYTDTFFFTVHIAAEVLDGPRLHDIPSIQTVCILLEVFDLDLLGERFFAGVDHKGQRVAGRFSTLIVFDGNRDEVFTCVLRCAA